MRFCLPLRPLKKLENSVVVSYLKSCVLFYESAAHYYNFFMKVLDITSRYCVPVPERSLPTSLWSMKIVTKPW